MQNERCLMLLKFMTKSKFKMMILRLATSAKSFWLAEELLAFQEVLFCVE